MQLWALAGVEIRTMKQDIHLVICFGCKTMFYTRVQIYPALGLRFTQVKSWVHLQVRWSHIAISLKHLLITVFCAAEISRFLKRSGQCLPQNSASAKWPHEYFGLGHFVIVYWCELRVSFLALAECGDGCPFCYHKCKMVAIFLPIFWVKAFLKDVAAGNRRIASGSLFQSLVAWGKSDLLKDVVLFRGSVWEFALRSALLVSCCLLPGKSAVM